MSEEEAGPYGICQLTQRLAAYLYASDSLIVSMQGEYLQWDFDTITKIFDHVVLRTNVQKVVSMIYQL